MKKIIVLVTLASALLGCGHANHEKSHNQESHEVADIELNNGQKWKVNEEMVPFVENSRQLLSAFEAKNVRDFKSLAEQLKKDNNGLIESCTMKGKSHEELHKWLYMHIQLVDELENAGSSEEAKEVVAKLNGSFQIYDQHFQ